MTKNYFCGIYTKNGQAVVVLLDRREEGGVCCAVCCRGLREMMVMRESFLVKLLGKGCTGRLGLLSGNTVSSVGNPAFFSRGILCCLSLWALSISLSLLSPVRFFQV
jgi:hypothetical protein